MKKLIPAFFVLLSLAVSAQKPDHYSKEISFLTDNDNYMLQLHDGYYSDGLFLNFSIATYSRKNKKKIVNWQIGQQVFTTESRHHTKLEEIDRPYTGYLFLQYAQTVFNKRSILQWNAELGTIGEASGGRAVQKGYHNLINIYEYRGWDAQLKSEPGINATICYMPLLYTGDANFKVVPALQATLGTSFTNAKAGAYFCLGAFEKDRQSVLWGSAIDTKPSAKNRKHELFAYYHPEVVLQGYNATVQGGLFRTDKGPFVADVKRIMYQHKIGGMFSMNNFFATIAVAYQTKEAATQNKNHRYGTIGIGFRFK